MHFTYLCVAFLVLALAACAPPRSTTPAGAPPKTEGTATSTSEWEKTLATARQEGKLVVMGPPGQDLRDGLLTGFQRKYPEIDVEFTGFSGGEQSAKLLTQRGAGQHLVDLYITGSQSIFLNLLPANALDPMPDYLVGPDIEPARWLDGKLGFSDNAQRYNVVMSRYKNTPMVYNRNAVSSSMFTSWKDILDPRWKGKIGMGDPTIPGSALDVATFWITRDGLGKEFVEQLFTQQGVAVTRNARQALDWVAQGQYPIGLGVSGTEAQDLMRRGVPLGLVDPEATFREGGFVTSGFGTVSVVNRPPHPNATRVYLNWLLSKEGQTDWTQASAGASRRLDVPTDGLPEYTIPNPGVSYVETYGEDYIKIKEDVALPFLRTVVKN
jgi:iron(III) transport system substrate-binding protein